MTLVVTAAASPLFGDFLMLVSVSAITNGAPITNLGSKNFNIAHLASLNHAAASNRTIGSVTEGPAGFYIVQLAKNNIQPTLPAGHYVFAVGATVFGIGPVGGQASIESHGQTIAVGDMVKG